MKGSSANIRFSVEPGAEFYTVLRQRVQSHFETQKISKKGNNVLYVKTVVLYFIYLTSFGLILFSGWPGWVLLLLCIPMGLGACGLGLSTMHDALHNSYSSSKVWNKLVGYTMEMLGGSSVTWKVQHNMLHHTYTNVYGMDEDIDDKPFLRMSPDGKLHWYHRFQHLYAPLLYGLSNASWLIKKDFVQFVRYWKADILKQVGVEAWPAFIRLVLAKFAYFFTVIGLPILILPYAWYWSVIGFLILQFVSGIIMTLVFLTAHAVGDVHHYQPDDAGNLENNWAIHQVRTTANFATNGFMSWFVGGLNYQIEHHLFPQISHVHYPQLAPIVKRTAKEFGVDYKEYPSFYSALAAHFGYLKDIGQPQYAMQ